MVVFWLFYNLVAGFRYQIGGDWFAYVEMIERIGDRSIIKAIQVTDSGFALATWLMTRIGLGIGAINTLCSGLLSLGVIRLARRTDHPWLAITAAVPYLLIVVGMGYIRQAAAIGFILFAINAMADRRNWGALIYLVLAASFHASALIMMPFLAVAYVRSLRLALILMGAVSIAGYFVLSGSGRFEQIQDNYIQSGYASSGAAIRILMNVGPALLFLFVRERLPISVLEKKVWILISLASLGLAIALPLSPSSTFIDRLGLLFSPIQIYVFGYLPHAFNIPARRSGLLIFLVVGYCIMTQLIWLNYAANAGAWVPYSSIFSRNY